MTKKEKVYTFIENNENYSLQNLDNYKNIVSNSLSEILEKYANIIIEFLNFVFENIKTKNNKYNKFLIIRGLDTITNVFHYLLFYTRNLELTIFHTQKSFYFYLEFIEQISQEQHVFLQLTSRDATMYVYKKTIFEINNDAKKNLEKSNTYYSNKEIFTNFIEISKFMRILVSKLINNLEDSKFIVYNETIVSDIDNLSSLFNKLSIINFNNIEIIKLLDNLIDVLSLNHINLINIYKIINLCIEKIIQNELSDLKKMKNTIFNNNLNNDNIENFLYTFY